MAYNIDFIKRAVSYKQNGHSFKELREAFDIPPETYYLWERRLESGYYDLNPNNKFHKYIQNKDLQE